METYATDLAIAQVIIIRVLVSFLLGVVIGIERGISHKTIGFRTISLVCVGSTCFTLISVYGFPGYDTGRVAAQVVSGIGFLGAGAILHKGYITKGLTTAAALWVAASVGMACGVGMFILGIVITLISLVLLWVLKPFKKQLDKIKDGEPKVSRQKQRIKNQEEMLEIDNETGENNDIKS